MRTGRRKEKRDLSWKPRNERIVGFFGLVGDKSFVLFFFSSPACATGCCCPETGKYCPPPPFFSRSFWTCDRCSHFHPSPPAAATDQSKVGRGHRSGDREEEKKKKLNLRFHLRPGLSVLLAPRSPGIEWRPGRRKEHKTDGPRFPTREILARGEKKVHACKQKDKVQRKRKTFFLFRPGQSGTHNV